jgi:hypothetical protein
MRSFVTLRLSYFLCVLAMLASSPPAQAFDHPGALHTQAGFDRMKAKVVAGAHPWIDSYNILINNSSAQPSYTPHAQANLQRCNGGGACLALTTTSLLTGTRREQPSACHHDQCNPVLPVAEIACEVMF